MKKMILSVLFVSTMTSFLFAQDKKEKEEDKGFKKENLFTGGSLTASFFSGGTVLGASPIFGYKLANWVDAGIAFNYTYSGRRDYIELNDKVRQHVYGPGVFARLYPVRFIFFQGQFEHNYTNFNYTDGFGAASKTKYDANSFLVGGGIAEGRQRGSNTFYYLSLLVDVIKSPNSPYVNNIYDNFGNRIRTDAIPIIRAGINVGLFQKRENRDEERGNGRRRPRSYNM